MRKRSRKASETEQVAEEPSPPPAKTRKRSASVKFTQTDEKRSQGNVRTRKKGFKVSFDIVEHNLSVGECATGVGASECVLTLGSTAEKKSPRAANGGRRGNGAGSNDVGGMVKKPIDIKFKNSDFTVSVANDIHLSLPVTVLCLQFSYLSSIKKRSWKSYKQIIAAERAFSWKPSDPTCEYSPGRMRGTLSVRTATLAT